MSEFFRVTTTSVSGIVAPTRRGGLMGSVPGMTSDVIPRGHGFQR